MLYRGIHSMTNAHMDQDNSDKTPKQGGQLALIALVANLLTPLCVIVAMFGHRGRTN